jgi:hypothetical protein
MTNVHVTGHRNEVTATVDSFLANLPEMLGAMKVDSRCLVAVIEFEDGRYVQFWVTSDGVVIGEVVSNLNINEDVALTSDQEEMLRARGWEEPSPGPKPNWRYEAHDVAQLIDLVAMTRDAVLHVLLETRDRTISMRSWSMDPPHERPTDDLLYEGRVYYQEALLEIEGRLNEV